MITSLPDNLSCTILSEWLTARDVVRMDEAHTNRDARPKWLTLLSLNGTKVRFSCTNSNVWRLAFPWIISRRVKFGALELSLQIFLQHSTNDELEWPFAEMVAFTIELHLHVMNVAYMAPTIYSAVRRGCPRLWKLILDGLSMLSVEQICAIVSPTTVSLEIRNCTLMRGASAAAPVFSTTSLQSVVLRNTRSTELLTDALLQSACPALEDLRTCGDISSAAAEGLVNGCVHLQCLEFASVDNEATLRKVVEGCRQLRVLSIKVCEGITCDTIRAIAHSGRALRMLSLNNLRRGFLDDTIIRQLADGIGANLLVLEIHLCAMTISHETAVHLLRSCPQLRGLRCPPNESALLSTNRFEELEQQLAQCPQLRDLEGCYCTGGALQLIAQHCPNLRHFSVDTTAAGADAFVRFLDEWRDRTATLAPDRQRVMWSYAAEAFYARFCLKGKRTKPSEHLPIWEEYVEARKYCD